MKNGVYSNFAILLRLQTPSGRRMSDLRKLVELLSQSVDAIEASCAARGVPLPSLNGPYSAAPEEAYKDPKVLEAASLVCAASNQLSLSVRPAKATLAMYILQVCPLSRPFNTRKERS